RLVAWPASFMSHLMPVSSEVVVVVVVVVLCEVLASCGNAQAVIAQSKAPAKIPFHSDFIVLLQSFLDARLRQGRKRLAAGKHAWARSWARPAAPGSYAARCSRCGAPR